MSGNYEGAIFYDLLLYGMNIEDVLGEFTIEFSYFYYYLHFLFWPPELLAMSSFCSSHKMCCFQWKFEKKFGNVCVFEVGK